MSYHDVTRPYGGYESEDLWAADDPHGYDRFWSYERETPEDKHRKAGDAAGASMAPCVAPLTFISPFPVCVSCNRLWGVQWYGKTCPACGAKLTMQEHAATQPTSGQCNPPVPTMEQDSHE